MGLCRGYIGVLQVLYGGYIKLAPSCQQGPSLNQTSRGSSTTMHMGVLTPFILNPEPTTWTLNAKPTPCLIMAAARTFLAQICLH